MVTVVTEGIFSLLRRQGEDRHRPPSRPRARARAGGRRGGRPRHDRRIRLADAVARRRPPPDRRLEEGGPRHLRDAARALQRRRGRAHHRRRRARSRSQAGRPPLVNGQLEERMRVGCGSATIGMFAKQWDGLRRRGRGRRRPHHGRPLRAPGRQGARASARPASSIKGRRSTPGRYFQVAQPGTGWGGTDIADPLAILGAFDPKVARPGLTPADGVHDRRACRLLRARRGAPARWRRPCRERLAALRRADPGELRAGARDGAVHGRGRRLAPVGRHGEPGAADALGQGRADHRHLRRRADLCLAGRRHHLHGRRARACPRTRFGYVPTPALVAPIEFTMRLADYARARRPHGRGAAPVGRRTASRPSAAPCGRTSGNPWPLDPDRRGSWPDEGARPTRSPDGRRLHLQDGPIDLVIGADGARRTRVERGLSRPRRPGSRRSSTSSAPSCRCCARRRGPGAAAPRGRRRAPHGGSRRALSRPRPSSRPWRRSRAAWRRRSSPP